MKFTIKNILDHYVRHYQVGAVSELEAFRSQKSLRSAIMLAALAEDEEGKRHLHQCRLSRAILEKGRDALLRQQNALDRSGNFDELFSLIEKATANIHGIGELYVYDCALRIGAFLNRLPERIYLHRGTRVGARALGYLGRGPLEVAHLPKEFRRLPIYQIEDVLCIYRDYFTGKTIGPVLDNCLHKSRHGCKALLQ